MLRVATFLGCLLAFGPLAPLQMQAQSEPPAQIPGEATVAPQTAATAPEKAAPEKAAPEKAAPEKAAVEQTRGAAATDMADTANNAEQAAATDGHEAEPPTSTGTRALPAAPPPTAPPPPNSEQLPPWNASRPEDLVLSLVTFGPGDPIPTYWGHDAMVVSDPRRGIEVMYNFGTFGGGPDMLARYLKGQLLFWVSRTTVTPVYRSYELQNRDVRVRELNLTPGQAIDLAQRLQWHSLPENRYYLYHHYKDNCALKLRDLINESLGGQLYAQAKKPARLSFREHTKRYTEHNPILEWLLILAMNDEQERSLLHWDESFLPDELELLLEQSTVLREGEQQPLVRNSYTVFKAQRPPIPENPSVIWPQVLALGLGLGLLALGLALWTRRGGTLPRVLLGLYHTLFGLTFGLVGLLIFLLLFTGWTVTHYNENLLLANPLLFVALPLGPAIAWGSRWAMRWAGRCLIVAGGLSVCAVLLKVVPAFNQDNWLIIALLLPLNLGFAAGHLLLQRRNTTVAAPRPATA